MLIVRLLAAFGDAFCWSNLVASVQRTVILVLSPCMKRGMSEFLALDQDCDAMAVDDVEQQNEQADATVKGDAAPSKAKPKVAPGRHKGGNSKKMRQCKACCVKKPETDFACNQVVDFECKRPFGQHSEAGKGARS